MSIQSPRDGYGKYAANGLLALAVLFLRAVSIDVACCSEVSSDQVTFEYPVTEDDRDHWAYRPLSAVAAPRIDSGWIRDPIDAFVLGAMQDLGLVPLPQADRAALVRRLSYDLTGLPPTWETVRRFTADPRPDAYERLVDEYLASAAYGERWGQFWLDLARFAETDGFEHDNVRPNAWRYRDWVIAALNEDLPYDEFIRLQIAGDQLTNDPHGQIATGFALCGPDMPDINDQSERRHFVLNEMTATIGSVVLAMQIGCAECHDHKYDPISQHDFYRFRAFFDSTVLFTDHDLYPGDAGDGAKGRVLKEREGGKAKSRLMVAGDFRRPGPELQAAFPRIANLHYAYVQSHDRGGTEQDLRPQLARWLTDARNPLTARVIANRVWQHHFGEGLVRTPSDFGVMGDVPRHPKLLDWLALDLVRSGWSIKRLHRRIVQSATYQQASRPWGRNWSPKQTEMARRRWATSASVDPENRYLARQNLRRLDAESIRDSVLACSGQLNRRFRGPGVMPPLPMEIRKSIRRDHWSVSPDPQDHARRSIYLFVRRNLRYPFLEVFDRPDPSRTCERRAVSTIATQSLAMLNSDLTHDAANTLAQSLHRELPTAASRITALYQRLLGRSPDPTEMQVAVEFLERKQDRCERAMDRPAAEVQALAYLSLGMLNLNEFIYLE